MQNSDINPVQHQIVLWVIWVAMLSAIPFFVFFLGAFGDEPQELSLSGTFLALLLPPFLGSVIVRWFILPKVIHKGPEAQLVTMIVGLALAEILVFFGIFLYSANFIIFLVFAVIGMAQFIPLWALPKKTASFQNS